MRIDNIIKTMEYQRSIPASPFDVQLHGFIDGVLISKLEIIPTLRKL